MMEEAIELMKAMFTQGQVSFQGQYYQVKDAVCQPRPVQKPWPRLWVGGAGEKVLLRAVAKHADGWNIPTISAEEYGHKLQVLQGHCQAVGRDYGEIVKSLECVAMVVEGREDMERVVDWAYARRGESRNVPPAAERTKLAQELQEKYLLGDLEQCRQKVARYVEVGVEYFMVYFLDYPSTRSLELFAREIAPRFKG